MSDGSFRIGWRVGLGLAAVAAAAILALPRTVPESAAAPPALQAGPPPGQATVPVTIVARRYSFSPARIEVHRDDLVTITLKAEDIPHSFTLDAYRIAKRAAPGHPAVFEFRADKEGTFTFYCNLSIDEGCRNMRGELIVRPRE